MLVIGIRLGEHYAIDLRGTPMEYVIVWGDIYLISLKLG